MLKMNLLISAMYKNNPNVVIMAVDTWENAKTEDEREKKGKDFIAQNNDTFYWNSIVFKMKDRVKGRFMSIS